MQFQFYEPTGGIFHDLSAPNLMSAFGARRSVKSRLKALIGQA